MINIFLMRNFYTITYLLFFLKLSIANAEDVSVEAIKPIDEIIAIVNDDVILASELQQRTRALYQQARRQAKSAPPLKIMVPKILERLILESLQLQLAARAGIEISSEELKAELANIAKQDDMSPEMLQNSIESEGGSFSAFQKNIENEMILQYIQQATVNQRIKITEQDITNFLQSEEGKRALSEEFHLAHIVINFSSENEIDKKKAIVLAKNILLQLDLGEPFSDLAKQYSSSMDSKNGGDLGWRSYKNLPSLYSHVATQLKTGEVSQVLIKTDSVHVVKLLEKRRADKYNYNVQQTHVRHILLNPSAIRNEEELVILLKKIREQILNGRRFWEVGKTLFRRLWVSIEKWRLRLDCAWAACTQISTSYG